MNATVDLRLQFEAVGHMPDDDQSVVMALLDGMIMKCQAKRMAGNLSIPELNARH